MNDERLTSLLTHLPKVELHVHLEGATDAETVWWLAQRNGVQLPAESLADWQQHYAFRDFPHFIEVYTLQVLPDDLRAAAVGQITNFVAADGTLLVISRGRDEMDDPGKMPWPLLRSELAEFKHAGLNEVAFEDYIEAEDPPVRRFRVEYGRRLI